MLPIPELIANKRDGRPLSADEWRGLLTGYQHGQVADYQMAALLMAVCFRGLEPDELATVADAMLHSGTVVDLSNVRGKKVDKHSTGGVGDKVSLSLAPLVASLGVRVPMVSGRGLGHTGGTLDKLESCPGFRVDLDLGRYRELVSEIGAALIGQTKDIAPLDKKLYALRDVTGTVESIPLIACSIMSKKLAEGIDALVLDIKVGNGAFMKDQASARELAQMMAAMGEHLGKRVVALLTQMSQPLGHAIGNALEWKEATAMLQGHGPSDYRDCVLLLAAEMLVLGDIARSLDEGRALAERAIADGRALNKWREMVKAQGGDPRTVDEPDRMPKAPIVCPIRVETAGFVSSIDTRSLGLLGVAMGAGRETLDSKLDPAAGLRLTCKVSDQVGPGQIIGEIHCQSEQAGSTFAKQASLLVKVGQERVPPLPLLLDRVDRVALK